MHFIYIIYSASIDKYYIGYSQDLIGRIEKHNRPHKGFTGQAQDWKLIYQEEYIEKSEALKREKEIKNWKSRSRIESLIGLR